MKKLFYSSIPLLFSLVVFASVINTDPKDASKVKTNAERMYDAIVLYADSFDVPHNIAFNVAYLETTYRGPGDSTYNHRQTSRAGAVGPMQIMPKYASYFAGFKVNKAELKDSIELNVYISMKILSEHYKKYNDWRKVLGAYNTGKPIINSYAKKGVSMNYVDNWLPAPKIKVEYDTLTNLLIEG
jgi:soluble lytic murein transglycosylase-like protein